MSKEYTYDIDKYTIGVDENGEDGIGMTVAKIENGKIKFLGNCYDENARCIDLLIKENQELKKQLHDASIQIQELIEKDIWCPSNCEKLEKLQQENKQLKDNWNKLKEWLKEYKEGTYGLGSYETGLSDGLGDVIKKMQKLEGSYSDD